MGKTPKIQRKTSLSLTSRIRNKRHSASPQNRIRTVLTSNAEATTPKSISTILSTSTDGGIECTPPHKKLNFDDSLDYSQTTLDCSFSPSGLLSQTLAIESPEVCWKWNRGLNDLKYDKTAKATATPDSAYAADSSFTSASSCSAKCRSNVRTRSYDKRREDQRRAMEQQLRKAEKIKQDEVLKQRCARLQKQLNEAQSNATREKENQHKHDNNVTNPSTYKISTRSTPKMNLPKEGLQNKKTSTLPSAGNKTLNDFFNDSDSDGLLLEATQQVESKIIELTQDPLKVSTTSNGNISPKSFSNTAPPLVSTPTSRSSFYSKFLEDDSPDDWFVSLDEVILQATHNKKPRTSFQRHNSMPSKTLTTVAATTTAGSVGGAKGEKVKKEDGVLSGPSKSLKRHASSHTISPSSSSSVDSIEDHLIFCDEIFKKVIETENKNKETNFADYGFRQGYSNALKFANP